MMNNNYKQLMEVVDAVVTDYKELTGEEITIELLDGTITDERNDKVLVQVTVIQIGDLVVEIDKITIFKKNIDEAEVEGLQQAMKNVSTRFAEVQAYYDDIDTHRMRFITTGIKQYDNIIEVFNRARAHALEIGSEDATEFLDTADGAMQGLMDLYQFIKGNLPNIYIGEEDITYKRPWSTLSAEEVQFNNLLQAAKDSRSGELAIGLLLAMEEL